MKILYSHAVQPHSSYSFLLPIAFRFEHQQCTRSHSLTYIIKLQLYDAWFLGTQAVVSKWNAIGSMNGQKFMVSLLLDITNPQFVSCMVWCQFPLYVFLFTYLSLPFHLCHQILSGIYPVAQVREPYTAVGYLAERVPLVQLLRLEHPNSLDAHAPLATQSTSRLSSSHAPFDCVIVLALSSPHLLTDNYRWASQVLVGMSHWHGW